MQSSTGRVNTESSREMTLVHIHAIGNSRVLRHHWQSLHFYACVNKRISIHRWTDRQIAHCGVPGLHLEKRSTLADADGRRFLCLCFRPRVSAEPWVVERALGREALVQCHQKLLLRALGHQLPLRALGRGRLRHRHQKLPHLRHWTWLRSQF